MSDQLFDVILFPKLKEGADPITVKARLAKLLKIDDARASALVESQKTTRLFRAVPKTQADKFYKAISACGITCNVAPTGGKPLTSPSTGGGATSGEVAAADPGSLSLIPMTEATRNFRCPNCGHTEEITSKEAITLCPSCKVNVAKLLEKEEREAEEMRLRQSQAAAEKRRLKEYEEKLRIELEKQIRARIEEEIRKEYGIGRGGAAGIWGFFMRNRALMTAAVFGALISVTAVLTLVIKDFLDDQERAAIAAAPPSAEMQALAPVLAAAASAQSPQVQQNVKVMAATTNAMAPPQEQVDLTAMSAAGITMMKGLDPSVFMAMAATTQVLGNTMEPLAAMAGLPVGGGSAGMVAMAGMSGGAAPMTMGMPGLAGQLGIPGLGEIPKDDFVDMMTGMSGAGPGQQTVMGMVSGNAVLMSQMPAMQGLEATRLEAMTPGEAAMLAASMAVDREWGRFLATRVDAMASDDPDAASALATLIPTPYERAGARARIAVKLQEQGLGAAARLMAERALDELDELEDLDTRAQAAVALGDLLRQAGSQVVASDVRKRLGAQLERTLNGDERAVLLGRVAVSHYIEENLGAANTAIEQAVTAAGTIQNDGARIKTFLGMAQRYADMSATPIAHTITNEAADRARGLPSEIRSAVFVASAKARAYMGDTERAARDLNLVGTDMARDQALTAVIEHLIIANEPYRAAQFIDAIEDPVLAAQLNLELIGQTLSDSASQVILQRLTYAQSQIDELEDPEVRALMLSRLARLQTRIGALPEAERNFDLAIEGARVARAEARDLILANITVDQAYALAVDDARGTAGRIANELMKTQMGEFLTAVAQVQASGKMTDPSYPMPAPEPQPTATPGR